MGDQADETVGPKLDSLTKPFGGPSCTPEELADRVSCLPNQQKAEQMYELVLFAAMAAEETGHPALNEFLAELEDLAAVYNDPKRRRDLRRTINESLPPQSAPRQTIHS